VSLTSKFERRDILDKLVSASSITSAGADFVRKSLDPFHDFQTPLEGFPDEDVSRVVIQEITKTLVISSNQGTGVTWDCHIATLPELNTTLSTNAPWSTKIGSMSSLGAITTSGTSQPTRSAIGPIVYSRVASGNESFISNVTGLPAAGTIDAVSFNEYFDGQKRIIGMAYEVVNTTAPLYRSGAVACYRMPQVNQTCMVQTQNADLSNNLGLAIVSRSPPTNIQQALLYTGSSQWSAEKGCYVVCVFDAMRNDLVGNTLATRVFTPSDSNAIASNVIFMQSAIANEFSPCKPLPFHTGGAYFTGLSEQTTLQLTIRLLVEVAPTATNSQLVVLAQPSPYYDPIAIEIYKRAAVQLPCGVPVDQNASGDFWDNVLSIIGKAAPLAAMVPGIGGFLAPAISGGVEAIKGFRNSSNKEKQNLNKLASQRIQNSSINFTEKPGEQNAEFGNVKQRSTKKKTSTVAVKQPPKKTSKATTFGVTPAQLNEFWRQIQSGKKK